MSEIAAGLLPEGLRDRLPPQAESAERLLRRLTDCVSRHGYERVAPPLAEFEESLVGRLSSARPQDLLRFVDPVSQRTLALRPDITGQVGRIAATRLAHLARPLRLLYGGPVLRVRGTQLRPDRQALQAGAELIGSDSVRAASEVILLAVAALEEAGVGAITVDLTLPDFVETAAAGPWPIAPGSLPEVQRLLDGKDVAGLRSLGAGRYEALISAAGPVPAALERLRALDLQGALDSRIEGAAAVAAAIGDRATVTLDPTERHGFEYQSWIGFSLFAQGIRGEIGRGGSYGVMHPDGRIEPAVGFSLYLDALVDAGFGVEQQPRLLLPFGASPEVGVRLRAEGWVTVPALEPAADPKALRCTHVWTGSAAVPVA